MARGSEGMLPSKLRLRQRCWKSTPGRGNSQQGGPEVRVGCVWEIHHCSGVRRGDRLASGPRREAGILF